MTSQLRWGAAFEGHVDCFRFGGGPMFGTLIVRRITRDTSLEDFTFGAELHLTFDVLRLGDHALYVGARGNFDFLLFAISSNAGTPVMTELSLLLGFRL